MPCILTQCGTAGLMISELSAGCDCRLFGTGLVMSENASDCTQNAAHLDRKVKKFQPPSHAPPPLGRGTSPFSTPLPTLGRGHPYPNPTPSAPRSSAPIRHLDSRAFGARPAAAPHFHYSPISHFWLRT